MGRDVKPPAYPRAHQPPAGGADVIFRVITDGERSPWYHTGMSTTHNNEETPRPAMIINLAKGHSEEEPELCEEPGEEGAWDNERPYGWDVPEDEYPDW
jgi:hypothetical protein